MQPRTNEDGLHPVFCTIVPPHVLDKLSHSGDARLADPARRTLEADGLRRNRRRLTALAGGGRAPPPPARRRAPPPPPPPPRR
ncbi:peptidase M4 family protein, partial [Streptomyces microflavus]